MVNKLLDLYLRFGKGIEISQCPTLNYQGSYCRKFTRCWECCVSEVPCEEGILSHAGSGLVPCPMWGGTLSHAVRRHYPMWGGSVVTPPHCLGHVSVPTGGR